MKKIHFFNYIVITLVLAMNSFAQQAGDTITYNGKKYVLYAVERSEGFFRISQKFNVSQQSIIEANPEYKDGLVYGSVIRIPIVESHISDEYELVTHEIKPGETVYSISRMYEKNASDIYKLNPNAIYGIKAGEQLVIEKRKKEVAVKTQPVESAVSKAEVVQTKSESPILPGSYTTHIVKKKETIYRISKNYDVEINDILAINPEITIENLPTGYALKVPVKSISKKEDKKEKDSPLRTAPTGNEELQPDSMRLHETLRIEELLQNTFNVADCKKVRTNLKIAILLPFMLDNQEPSSTTLRFVEFYQGALIAVDSLRKEGLNVELYPFDTQKTESSIDKVLYQPILKDVDLIIGPAYSNQIKKVSDFALENEIPFIVPFSSKSEEVYTNPYMFQYNISNNDQMCLMADKFFNDFKNDNIIIVYPLKEDKYTKKVFVDSLKSKMALENMANIHFVPIDDSLKMKSFDEFIDTKHNQMNTIIVPTTDPLTLNKSLPHINSLPKKNLQIFGFSEWNNIQTADLYVQQTYSYAQFKFNKDDRATRRFLDKYLRFFGAGTMESNPNYAVLGYDITFHFLSALQYGDEFYNCLNYLDIKPLQSGFEFKKVGEEGGYINTFMHLTTY